MAAGFSDHSARPCGSRSGDRFAVPPSGDCLIPCDSLRPPQVPLKLACHLHSTVTLTLGVQASCGRATSKQEVIECPGQ